MINNVSDIWKWLEKKYGRHMKLTTVLIRRRQAFQCKKNFKMDPAKFIDLYKTWRKVYNHMKVMGQESTLNHGPTLNLVTKRLSENMLRKWVRVRTAAKHTDKS